MAFYQQLYASAKTKSMHFPITQGISFVLTLKREGDPKGFKNLKSLKGGVSGICKAVYSGIREQKIN
jgi:hypothetical protein